jgi:hypothetical protein
MYERVIRIGHGAEVAATELGRCWIVLLTSCVDKCTDTKGEHHKKHSSKVKQVIGPEGETISLPDRGFTMVFPTGAVAAPVHIEIFSDKYYVAYTMKPAGTVFLKDVTITQLLKPTALKLDMMRDELHAAYIGDSVQLSHSVPVLELEPSRTIFSTTLPFLPEAHVWIIRHFSRYMLASG